MTKQLDSAPEQTQPLIDDQVVAYLRANPGFFVTHEALLKELTFPHVSGAAISLGERQVQVFREHRDELRAQLNELLIVAKENDEHFEKSKRLLLNLLDINNLDEIELVVQEAFKDDENIDFARVMVFGEQDDYPVSDLRVMAFDEAAQQLGGLVESQKAICGHFSTKQLSCLFQDSAGDVGSAAIIPLRNGELLGVFALGSKDPNHFDSSMGSLFLSYISDFISRILPGLLLRSRSKKTAEKVPSLLD
jgi:uncharacterized protein YigA (DUF484 family)